MISFITKVSNTENSSLPYPVFNDIAAAKGDHDFENRVINVDHQLLGTTQITIDIIANSSSTC